MGKLKTFTCRSCGVEKPTALRYETSDWCVPCVQETLEQQQRERFAPQFPQVVEYDPEGDE